MITIIIPTSIVLLLQASGTGLERPKLPGVPTLGRLSGMIPNEGQLGDHAIAVIPSSGASLFVIQEGLALQLGMSAESECRVLLHFQGSAGADNIEYIDQKLGVYNYIQSGLASHWTPGVRSFSEVYCRGLYEGVDLRVRMNGDHPEYDLFCESAAAASQVTLRFIGADSTDIQEDGGIRLLSRDQVILHQPPTCWTKSNNGDLIPIAGRYCKLTGSLFGLELAESDLPIIIDPAIVYSTGVGPMSGGDFKLALDDANNVYVSGITGPANFFPTPGAFDTTYNGGQFSGDACIVKFNNNGTSLLYATYVGGAGDEWSAFLAVDKSGSAYITGMTTSPDFPTTLNAPVQAPGYGGYLFKLNPSGNSMLFSTYLSSSGTPIQMSPNAIAVDDNANAYSTGQILGPSLVSSGPSYQPLFQGTYNDYVVKVNSLSGLIGYSTYFGQGGEFSGGIGLDGTGGVWMSGETSWTSLPTTPTAFDHIYGDPNNPNPGVTLKEGFLIKLNSQGTALEYASYLGGLGFGPVHLYPLFCDAKGFVYVSGRLHSVLPQTPGAYISNAWGAYVMKIDPSLPQLMYATNVVPTGAPFTPTGWSLDKSGNIYVTFSTSPQYTAPMLTPDALKSTLQNSDGYIVKINSTGTGAIYSSYIGGSQSDATWACAAHGDGSVVVLGSTNSPDFPITPGAYNSSVAIGTLTLTDFELPNDPYGVSLYGVGTAGCDGHHRFTTSTNPQVGKLNFQLLCEAAPKNSLGIALVSDVQDVLGSDSLYVGALFHIGFQSATVFGIDLHSDPWGIGRSDPMTLPADPALVGQRFFAQAAWIWSSQQCSPSPFGISTSNGIEITFL